MQLDHPVKCLKDIIRSRYGDQMLSEIYRVGQLLHYYQDRLYADSKMNEMLFVQSALNSIKKIQDDQSNCFIEINSVLWDMINNRPLYRNYVKTFIKYLKCCSLRVDTKNTDRPQTQIQQPTQLCNKHQLPIEVLEMRDSRLYFRCKECQKNYSQLYQLADINKSIVEIQQEFYSLINVDSINERIGKLNNYLNRFRMLDSQDLTAVILYITEPQFTKISGSKWICKFHKAELIQRLDLYEYVYSQQFLNKVVNKVEGIYKQLHTCLCTAELKCELCYFNQLQVKPKSKLNTIFEFENAQIDTVRRKIIRIKAKEDRRKLIIYSTFRGIKDKTYNWVTIDKLILY